MNARTKPPPWRRGRLTTSILMAAVMALGLTSRNSPVPDWFRLYGGDTLWALLVYLGLGLLFPRLSVVRTATLALLFAFALEVSQLCEAEWLEELRRTRLGGLILGFGFLWSDLVCYSLGVGLGASVDWLRRRRTAGATAP